MSQIANITVFDGAAAPVSHTLTAIEVTKEKGVVKALWREALAGLPVYAQISALASITKLKSGVYRTDLVVSVPVMESISGQNAAGYTAAPKVAYTNTYTYRSFHHERSDITGRRLGRMILANLLNNISVTTAAVTTGPVPELIDQLVAPT